jgi:hypothetical protein
LKFIAPICSNILNGPSFLKLSFVLSCFVLMCFLSRYTLFPFLSRGPILRFLLAYIAVRSFENAMSIASYIYSPLSLLATTVACSTCVLSFLGC